MNTPQETKTDFGKPEDKDARIARLERALDQMAQKAGELSFRLDKREEELECAKRRVEYAEAQGEELARLREKMQMTLGVGSGDGSLYVHGDYESIKACQAQLLNNETLRDRVAELEGGYRQQYETIIKLKAQRAALIAAGELMRDYVAVKTVNTLDREITAWDAAVAGGAA